MDAGIHGDLALADAAGDGPEALVHRAVAVVVQPVAVLGAGGPGHAGLRLAAHAVVHLVHAGADAAGGGAEAFVHRAVAVVVQAVADLDIGGAGLTGDPLTGHAVARGHLAEAHAAGGAAQALVHETVAVVVQAVAVLGDRGPGLAGLHLSVHAVVHLVEADPGATGQGAEALVDLAVAVVVHEVAGLGEGRAGHAVHHLAVLAVLLGHLAGAHAAGGRAEALVEEAVAVVVRAVADLDDVRGEVLDAHVDVVLTAVGIPAEALGEADQVAVGAEVAVRGVAGVAEEGEVLVGLPVAVVVQAVAELGEARPSLVDALDVQAIRGAGQGAVLAEVRVRAVAGLTEEGEVLVGLPVAVVVQAIADLGDVRLGLVDALDVQAVGGAGVGAVLAEVQVRAVAGRAEEGEVLVDLPVAVVVQAVTELGAAGVVAEVGLEELLLPVQGDGEGLGGGGEHPGASREGGLVDVDEVVTGREAVEEVAAVRVRHLGAHEGLVAPVEVRVLVQVDRHVADPVFRGILDAVLVRVVPHGVADGPAEHHAELRIARGARGDVGGRAGRGRRQPSGLHEQVQAVGADGEVRLVDHPVGAGELREVQAQGPGDADQPLGEAGLTGILDAVRVLVVPDQHVEVAEGLSHVEDHRRLGLPEAAHLDGVVLHPDLVPAGLRVRGRRPAVRADDGRGLGPGRRVVDVQAGLPLGRHREVPPDEVVEDALDHVVVRIEHELDVVVRRGVELDGPVVELDPRPVVHDGGGRRRRPVDQDRGGVRRAGAEHQTRERREPDQGAHASRNHGIHAACHVPPQD